MTKGTLRKKTLFTSQLDLNLRMNLAKCYIWSIAVYGDKNWTLRKIDQKYLESFEMWCWRRKEKIQKNFVCLCYLRHAFYTSCPKKETEFIISKVMAVSSLPQHVCFIVNLSPAFVTGS
jgi:hypothetical protein